MFVITLFDVVMQHLQRQPSGPTSASVPAANDSSIQALPTHFYRAPSALSSVHASNPDFAKCLICLTDYEEKDELRTLPCFHNFQYAFLSCLFLLSRECIDNWLKLNKKCPTCRYDVC